MGLEVVLPNGEITQFGGKVVKNSSGYDLKNLIIGSIYYESDFKITSAAEKGDQSSDTFPDTGAGNRYSTGNH